MTDLDTPMATTTGGLAPPAAHPKDPIGEAGVAVRFS